jgi:membrane associated rhomboid family serine protease
MNTLDYLEKKFGRFVIPNLTLYIITGQVILFVINLIGKVDLSLALLVPQLVFEGQWWRLLFFIFIPPAAHPVFIIFAWYFFYLMGSALEGHWGEFRFNLFLLVGYIVTVAVSFLFPLYPATNIFIGGSVFLAFAFLYPDFEILIFFILPIKIKWLALLTWIGYAIQFILGPWPTRLIVLASISNFFLFFGKDILWRMRAGNRQMIRKAKTISGNKDPFHRCTTCGITDLSHPEMEFRYCSECGSLCYCSEHIKNHEHVKKA